MSHNTYEVRVSGLLPEEAAAAFGDVRVTTTDVSTVLSGELPDQAALLGLLARLREAGMNVMEVRRVLVREPARRGAGPTTRRPERDRSPPSGMTPGRGAMVAGLLVETHDTAHVRTSGTQQRGRDDRRSRRGGPDRLPRGGVPRQQDDRGGLPAAASTWSTAASIRILDLAFVRKELDGSVAGLAMADLDGDGELDLAVFEGASSGLLDTDDIDEAGDVLEPGSSAGRARLRERLGGTVRRARSGAPAASWSPAAGSRSRPCSLRWTPPSRSADRSHPRTTTTERERTLMPGLIRGVARTAVIAGTATAVSNRVSRRQAGRWAAKDQQQCDQQQAQQYAEPAPQYAPPAAARRAGRSDMDAKLAQLKQLGELKEQGVLSERRVRGAEEQDPHLLNRSTGARPVASASSDRKWPP